MWMAVSSQRAWRLTPWNWPMSCRRVGCQLAGSRLNVLTAATQASTPWARLPQCDDAGVVALVGGDPGEALGGGRLPVPEDRVHGPGRGGAVDDRRRRVVAGRGGACFVVLVRFGLGHQVGAELVASLPGLEQLGSSGELGRHGSGPFGVDLAAGPLDQLDPFGARWRGVGRGG